MFNNSKITCVAVDNAIKELKDKADYITSDKNKGIYDFLKTLK